MDSTNRRESIIDGLYIIERVEQNWSGRIEYIIRIPYKTTNLKGGKEIWYRTYCILSNDEFKIIYRDIFE